MTAPGCVTCEQCQADHPIGRPHRCEPETPPPPISRTALLPAPAMSPPAPIDAQPPKKPPQRSTPAKPDAPLLPLPELMRQFELHRRDILARVQAAAPYDETPPEILDDLAILKALGRHLDDSVCFPKGWDELKPEQEADCEAHRDTDSLAAIFLRRLAHCTGDRWLLDRVNMEADAHAIGADLEKEPLTLAQIAGRIAAVTDQLMRGTIDPPRARATLYALQTAAVALKMQTADQEPPCPTRPLLTAPPSEDSFATASTHSAPFVECTTVGTPPKRNANKSGKRAKKRSPKSARR